MYEKIDKAIIRDLLKEGKVPAGEPVVLKIYVNTTAGDPTKGIAKTFVFNKIKDFAVISAVEQQDVVYSGGIYLLGDVKVQLTRELKPIDDSTKSPGDRLLWRGNEYRQVGKINADYLEGYVLYNYVFRRV
jgi:hypothetical protein